MDRSLRTLDRFAPEGRALRAHFDARLAGARSGRSDRFVWDYWHVPGQYTALRTPAYAYFPRAIYAPFHRRLIDFGRRVLGCHDVSPPWLSCYVEGCEQRLHGDLPHGPWAFVYSLTRWDRRRFTGGETLLLKEEVLDFWQGFVSIRAVEEPELLRAIPPRFGRLTVFDPRIPHGVREVRGTHDPREGRLVIHGWFVQPRPFIEGPLSQAALATQLRRLDQALGARLADAPPLAGLLSLGFTVRPDGAVTGVRALSDTTRVPAADERRRRALVRAAQRLVAELRFPRGRGPSRVVLPLVFERG